jgi:DNA-directed RNA polymerase subunit alpha
LDGRRIVSAPSTRHVCRRPDRLVQRSEADLLDIRNFGAKSIDEVMEKFPGMGLALKDSPSGFNPPAAAFDADAGFVETEQY